MIVDTMTGKDIVREFNRDIDSIDKIAERMAVKKRRILLKMKNQMTFPHFGEITQMKVGNNRYYLVWKCLSRNSLNYTVFTKCGKRIYAYSTDTTVLEFTRHFLDRYNERFKIVGLDNILRNICKDFCLGKIFDSTVVTDTGLFIMTETDYGFSAVTWGRVITLTGTHAFEYTIHIEGIRTVTETFVNGKLARKRFNELKRKP